MNIEPVFDWLVRFTKDDEEAAFAVEATSDNHALQLAAVLLAEEGEDPTKYQALVIRIFGSTDYDGV